jgi:hypothetical protein
MNELNLGKSAAKLRVVKILFDAFTLVWFRRTDFMHALWLPFLLMIALTATFSFSKSNLPAGLGWIIVAAYYFLLVLFAVNCHRVVLLDSVGIQEWKVPKWSWRETRFLAWCAFFYVLAALCGMVGMTIFVIIIGNITTQLLGSSDLKSSTWTVTSGYVIGIIYAYIFARLSIMFPSIAIDKNLSFQQTVKLTRGNGWRLVIIVSVLPWAIQIILSSLIREDYSFVEYMLWLIITCALLTVEITALSLSYRELAEHAEPQDAAHGEKL